MMDMKIMTPGPTMVRENVRMARALETTNPDLDEQFVEEYRQLCLKIASLLHTKSEVLILGGEGILGLEAACASLTGPRAGIGQRNLWEGICRFCVDVRRCAGAAVGTI